MQAILLKRFRGEEAVHHKKFHYTFNGKKNVGVYSENIFSNRKLGSKSFYKGLQSPGKAITLICWPSNNSINVTDSRNKSKEIFRDDCQAMVMIVYAV